MLKSLVHYGQVLRGVAQSRTSAVQVFRQQRHPGEGLAAVGARVLLDVGVCLEMSTEVGAVGERPVTKRTREGFLAGVGTDVSLQQPWSREGFATEDTLAGEGVRPDVHLESTQRHVDFLTVLAAEALLGGGLLVGGAVELLMLRQSRVRGVGLGTEGTLVPRGGTGLLDPLPIARTSGAGASRAGHATRRREVLRCCGWR